MTFSKMAKKIVLLFALLFMFCACDREYYVETPVGTWQMADALIIARSPLGETIEASSMKELATGVLGVIKKFFPDEDYSEAEAQIGEMDDIPFTFTEDRTFRFAFLKDGTFRSYTRDDNGVWTDSGTAGEYSYAGYRLTLYNTREDGTNSTVPCTVIRLTNKKLVLQMKVADLLDLPGGTPLQSGSAEEDGDAAATVLSMLGMIDLTTELSFDHVR